MNLIKTLALGSIFSLSLAVFAEEPAAPAAPAAAPVAAAPEAAPAAPAAKKLSKKAAKKECIKENKELKKDKAGLEACIKGKLQG